MNIKQLKRKFPKKDVPETPFYVSVAGNIGVGKSMITTMIGEVFGWQMHFEPVINNPYLDDYYKDMPRWSFHLQVYFLSKRFEVQKEILDGWREVGRGRFCDPRHSGRSGRSR